MIEERQVGLEGLKIIRIPVEFCDGVNCNCKKGTFKNLDNTQNILSILKMSSKKGFSL